MIPAPAEAAKNTKNAVPKTVNGGMSLMSKDLKDELNRQNSRYEELRDSL